LHLTLDKAQDLAPLIVDAEKSRRAVKAHLRQVLENASDV
jgi:hypothetical protein